MGQIFCLQFGKTVSVDGVGYTIVRGIGEGAFSFVQLVTKSSKQYALKRILIQVPERLDMVHREVSAHRMIEHPNVMPLVAYEIIEKGSSKEGRLLFPYHKLGSLQEMIEVSTITQNPIEEQKILHIFRSICGAVNAFHTHDPPFAHRDIKPHNLLLSADNQVVLMDLGSAREARVRVTSRQEALALQELGAQECTAAYRAPELFEVPSECEITEKTDVWALGCTLYALAYGDSPCDGSALSAVSLRVVVDNEKYSEGLNKLIYSMLNVYPAERPSVGQLIDVVDRLLTSVSEETSGPVHSRGIELGITNNGNV